LARWEGRQDFLLRQLTRRFGDLPGAITDRVKATYTEDLMCWFDRSMDAASLDDVFALP
jgi:hypothetical protein